MRSSTRAHSEWDMLRAAGVVLGDPMAMASKPPETPEPKRGFMALTALQEICDDEETSWRAKIVELMLLRHAAQGTGKSFPSLELMAAEAGVSSRTIRRGIRELEKLGKLVTGRSQGRRSNVYWMLRSGARGPRANPDSQSESNPVRQSTKQSNPDSQSIQPGLTVPLTDQVTEKGGAYSAPPFIEQRKPAAAAAALEAPPPPSVGAPERDKEAGGDLGADPCKSSGGPIGEEPPHPGDSPPPAAAKSGGVRGKPVDLDQALAEAHAEMRAEQASEPARPPATPATTSTDEQRSTVIEPPKPRPKPDHWKDQLGGEDVKTVGDLVPLADLDESGQRFLQEFADLEDPYAETRHDGYEHRRPVTS